MVENINETLSDNGLSEFESGRLDTKEAILAESLDLFAKNGFSGTSIRQIASAAGVNVAAINYHFKSKHNLYWAVMTRSHELLSNEVQRLSEVADTFEELVVLTFRFAYREENLFRSTLKMMIDSEVPPPDSDFEGNVPQCQDGPPGAEVFASKLKQEVSAGSSTEDLDWAVKASFASFFHWATICTTNKFALMQVQSGITYEDIEGYIRRTVRAVVGSI